MSRITPGERTRFLFRNLLQGFLWLAVILFLFWLFRYKIDLPFSEWLEPILGKPFLVFLIYTLSEFFFGIIPPELFMLWALNPGDTGYYIRIVSLLSVISYLAGITGYGVGYRLGQSVWFRFLRRRFFGKLQGYLNRFGVFVILVAALTPLPFSGASMLIGSGHYPLKRYALWALSRFLRFLIYGFIVWKAAII
ncbi:MAG: VTT domain-containing protein [Bacteroidales bacterium]